MKQADKHAVLADSIMRLAQTDGAAFVGFMSGEGAPHGDYAYAIAQRLVRNLEEQHVTIAAIPGTGGLHGHGRVTSTLLDQRLAKSTEAEETRP